MKKLDREQRRGEIAASAAALIAEQGLEALSTRNLAKSMGCTIGVVNHYFDGKEDLVEAALNWANERIFERMAAAIDGEASLEGFGVILESALPITTVAEMEWRVRLNTWNCALVNRDVLLAQRKRSRFVAEMMTSLMANLQQAGEIRDDVDVEQAGKVLIDLVLGVGFEMLHLPKSRRAEHSSNIRFYLKSLR